MRVFSFPFLLKPFVHVLFGMLFLFNGDIEKVGALVCGTNLTGRLPFPSLLCLTWTTSKWFVCYLSYIGYEKLLIWIDYRSINVGTQKYSWRFYNLRGDMLWFLYSNKMVSSGFMWKWCYFKHNLLLKKIVKN